MEPTRNQRNTLTGIVIGTRMHKTITVRVETMFRHPKYGKYVRHRKKYFVHDENEVAGDGDMVEIGACRPISKLKRWRLVSVVQAAPDRGAEVGLLAAADDVLGAKKKAGGAA